MRVRRVILTKTANISAPDDLVRHKNVVKCWRLPYDQVLFEFYHPVFDSIYEDDMARKHAALQDEATRALSNTAASIERELLAPLFREVKDISDATMLFVPTKPAFYLFLGRRRNEFSWPDLGVSPGWESQKRLRVAGCLRQDKSGQNFAALESALAEWITSMAEKGMLIERNPTVFRGGYYFNTLVRCEKPSGDALMALYMLLTLSATETGLEKIGYFDEDDFASEFLQIGGSRRSNQLFW